MNSFTEYNKAYYAKNRDRILAKHKSLRENPEFREKARIKSKQFRAANPEFVKARDRLRNTGWTHEEYLQAWKEQAGLCASCGIAMSETGRGENSANADHCHETDKKRELLCNACNLTAGHIESDRGKKVLEYLRKHDALRV